MGVAKLQLTFILHHVSLPSSSPATQQTAVLVPVSCSLLGPRRGKAGTSRHICQPSCPSFASLNLDTQGHVHAKGQVCAHCDGIQFYFKNQYGPFPTQSRNSNSIKQGDGTVITIVKPSGIVVPSS